VEGDVVKIGLKQNDCGGEANALISQYVKVTDNLFYSFNKSFGVSPTVVLDGTPVDVVLQPFTEAIAASREDHCGRREDVVNSFMKISRTKVEPLDLQNIELPPQTSAEVHPDELVKAEQKNISVPFNTETIVIPSDVVSALAPAGGTVTVSVDSGEPKSLIEGSDLSLALPSTAKSIIFKVTDSKGRVTQVTKPIARQPETEIVQAEQDPTQVVPQAQGTPASEVSDTSNSADGSASSTSSDSNSSGSSPMLIGIAVVVILVLAALALNGRRKKAAK
ncbi:MAG: hypothetical protein ACKOFD_03770, partial [Actinomycetota bacterium]